MLRHHGNTTAEDDNVDQLEQVRGATGMAIMTFFFLVLTYRVRR